MIYLKEYIKLWFPINYIPFFLGVQLIFGQDAISGSKNNSNSNEYVSIDELENRFPIILADAKSFFSEAIIADHHGDSLEVLYLLDKIVELLNGAEQLGEMSDDDQEEFSRF